MRAQVILRRRFKRRRQLREAWTKALCASAGRGNATASRNNTRHQWIGEFNVTSFPLQRLEWPFEHSLYKSILSRFYKI